MADESKSFWSTLPGFFTGLAALITAITGLAIYFNPKPAEANRTYQTQGASYTSTETPRQNETEVSKPGDKKDEPTVPVVPPKPITKIEGVWSFVLHSDASNNTLNGKVTIQSNESKGENFFIGHIETDNKTQWNNFSSDLEGTFINNEIKFSRTTGVPNVSQLFELSFVSENKYTGTFHNAGDPSPAYKDNGTMVIER